MSPLAHALRAEFEVVSGLPICKFLALQLASRSCMHGPGPWQQQRGPVTHTEMKFISLGYALYSPTWAEQTWVIRQRETRYDALSLVPRPSRPVFVIHGSSKTNSGFFPCVSTASGKCWGKNGQGKSLGDTA